MANVASLAEVNLAKQFLRSLGAPATSDMIYAVISWMRVSAINLSQVTGNNPFMLDYADDIADLANGKFWGTKAGYSGYFATFKTLEQGIAAAAKRLQRAGTDYRLFNLVISAAKSGRAVDFLTALALSAWDQNHYGYTGSTETNKLYAMYITFTGMQVVQPGKPKPAPPPKKISFPAHPRDLAPPESSYAYIDPWRVRGFYRARHRPPTV